MAHARLRLNTYARGGISTAPPAESAANVRSDSDSPPPWLRRVAGMLRDRAAETHTLSALAAEACCHSSHLARAFRRYYGCPVGDYLRGLRLNVAARVRTTARLRGLTSLPVAPSPQADPRRILPGVVRPEPSK